ncbi:MAG: TIGR03084 family protein [Gammaproteobacteria bacterium]|nr:TIGR03084 family protein [Gammaproteobacteria bacterium]
MQQAQDFLDESERLNQLVASLSDLDLEKKTAFKGWTINHVLGHLYVWNLAAGLSLTDEDAFMVFIGDLGKFMADDGSIRQFEDRWLDGLKGAALVETWLTSLREIAAQFGDTDPAARLKWAGPDMSARSSITARLMETWAHGQEVYDLLGEVRVNSDAVRNIVVLGNNTYGWTYSVRGEVPPEPRPCLKLTAPSGDLWTYNEPGDGELIEGLAEEFCQVVTQVRNIADTNLKVTGDIARDWMSKAQCFAGGAHAPPEAGTRKTGA